MRLKMMLKWLISVCVCALCACSAKPRADEKTMYIAAATRPCTAGVMKTQCLQIKWKQGHGGEKAEKDWQHFYSPIEGFAYENGNNYELIVREEKVNKPPADAASIKYKLVKIISQHKVPDTHNSRNSLNYEGVYSGLLPCANCNGIQTTITLKQDGSFTRSEQYLGKTNMIYQEKGKFEWHQNGDDITLVTNDRKQRYKVAENKLFHLDEDGHLITGPLGKNYVLSKK